MLSCRKKDFTGVRIEILIVVIGVSEFMRREQLQHSGCGAVDLLLIGSVLLTSDAVLWTLEKNLEALAARFEISFG